MTARELAAAPLPLEPTRVRRTYRGGSGLDRWHGLPAAEGDRPEEWLASMTEAHNPGFAPVADEGLSAAVVAGQRVLLRDLVARDPAAMLGQAHAARYGSQPGVLAKVIDSAERLSIQVHPDKAFARRYFHSEYGKTECWHILGTRTVDGQPPCLLMGFRPGVTRTRWEALYQRQDIPGMLACLNRVTPRVGETWLIRGGMPHAIGPGCRLVEIQEPTDYTLRSERTRADGSPIPDALIHQGLGEAALLECFHYEPMDGDALRAACCLAPTVRPLAGGGQWQLLVGPRDTPCFAMERVTAVAPVTLTAAGRFSVLAVLEGQGVLGWPGGRLPLRPGGQLFLPAGVGRFTLCGDGGPVTVIRCHPPGADPAAPAESTAPPPGSPAGGATEQAP